jgi:hypothetical protein
MNSSQPAQPELPYGAANAITYMPSESMNIDGRRNAGKGFEREGTRGPRYKCKSGRLAGPVNVGQAPDRNPPNRLTAVMGADPLTVTATAFPATRG